MCCFVNSAVSAANPLRPGGTLNSVRCSGGRGPKMDFPFLTDNNQSWSKIITTQQSTLLLFDAVPVGATDAEPSWRFDLNPGVASIRHNVDLDGRVSSSSRTHRLPDGNDPWGDNGGFELRFDASQIVREALSLLLCEWLFFFELCDKEALALTESDGDKQSEETAAAGDLTGRTLSLAMRRSTPFTSGWFAA